MCDEDKEEPSTSKDSKCLSPKPSEDIVALQSSRADPSVLTEGSEQIVPVDGSVSPRTLHAIQRCLDEEEDSVAPQPDPCDRPLSNVSQPVVVSSSEDETIGPGKPGCSGNPTGLPLLVRDCLSVSGSEDEMEEVIGQRNKALHVVAQHHHRTDVRSTEENTQLDVLTGSRGRRERQTELQNEESGQRLVTVGLVQSQTDAASIVLTDESHEERLRSLKDIPALPSQLRTDVSVEGLDERHGGDVKSEDSDGSESEGKT